MEEVNKNTELNNTDKKLHISDVMFSSFYECGKCKLVSNEHKEHLEKLVEQAKQMEKEQIINSHVTGIIEPLIMKNYKGFSVDEIKAEITKQAEEYYEETFKNETK